MSLRPSTSYLLALVALETETVLSGPLRSPLVLSSRRDGDILLLAFRLSSRNVPSSPCAQNVLNMHIRIFFIEKLTDTAHPHLVLLHGFLVSIH